MNNSLFARELKQRFPDQIIVAQAGPYQDVMIVCYDSLYFSDAFRDLLTARSARLVNWTRDLQPLGHDSDHCMHMTIAPKHREYWAQDRRRQISLKLSPESDAVLLEYLDHVDNIQGLIKSLLIDHIAATRLEPETCENCDCWNDGWCEYCGTEFGPDEFCSKYESKESIHVGAEG